MRYKFVYPIILLLTIYSCDFGKEKINISGKATGYSDSTIVILRNFDTQAIVDTTFIINNKFSFAALKCEPTPYGILIGNSNRPEFLLFFLENVDISITGEKGRIKYSTLDGGEIQGQLNSLNKILQPLTVRFDSVNAELIKALEAKDMEKVELLSKQEDTIIPERIALGAKYIKENPNNLISAFTLKGYIAGLPKSEIKLLYENLSPKIKKSEYAKSIFKFLELSADVNIGDTAKDFELPNLNGNIISLKNFRGKYVLLEFWEAGCRACRTENKYLFAEYKLYKDKGFEIISITSDKNRKNWESATKQDSIIWTNLQDSKTKDGHVGARYNVKLIPSNFLLDPNGRIIATNLRGEKLGEKLKELF
ncbi:MAG: TlpA disulfide reductase family protein [Bacteroidales bacterium]|jgi:peroxiredoxin|nr:TlpA disulfide reductase family protein [Bacteroidales bacterium]MDD4177901.1 TlpA disulfide reductase family protein [Bacteroidales bacterium]NCU36249.1 AhpC/TSA family protein [Candidatus Falkowbacteria bacterium]